MTIETLIRKVKEEKPNAFSDERLIGFINEIEAEVAEILHKYTVPVYTTGSTDSELLAPAPYDRLYVTYVKAMIDYANEELEPYANNAAQHAQDMLDFQNWVVRTGQVQDSRFPKRFRNVL